MTLAAHNTNEERLSYALNAFLATDEDKEKNHFCQGPCHLPKFSQRLSSVDIANIGAQTLLEVLTGFPGLFITKDRFNRPQLGIDGILGQSRILILIDGVPYQDPVFSEGFLSFPAFLIDTIDVFYGPDGSWFGEKSLAGVIDISLKKNPGILYHSFLTTDQSLGSSMSITYKSGGTKASIFTNFSVLHPADHQNPLSSPLSTSINDFKMKNLTLSGLFDTRLSHQAQAYLTARSTVIMEINDLDQGLTDASLHFGQKRLAFINDLHIIRKKAQKNALDIFFTVGHFQIKNTTQKNTNTLLDTYNSWRLESGVKFHLKPLQNHDLFGGIGGTIATIAHATHENPYENTVLPIQFSHPGSLFGYNFNALKSTTGHVYGFIQDEWQIRAPLLLALGSRVILPIESAKFSASFLPFVGITFNPLKRLQIKLSLKTSIRTPNFYEESDHKQDALIDGTIEKYLPTVLEPERSRTLEAGFFYASTIDTANLKNGLSFHYTKISHALKHERATSSNNFEQSILGARFTNETIFQGGHRFWLGLFYTLSQEKAFDEKGQESCHYAFFGGDPSSDICEMNKSMPRFILKTSLHLDLLTFGTITLSNAFLGMTKIDNVVKDPFSLMEASFQTKPLWRYVVLFLTIKGGLGGKVYRPDQIQNIAQKSFSFERLIAMAGFSIAI